MLFLAVKCKCGIIYFMFFYSLRLVQFFFLSLSSNKFCHFLIFGEETKEGKKKKVPHLYLAFENEDHRKERNEKERKRAAVMTTKKRSKNIVKRKSLWIMTWRLHTLKWICTVHRLVAIKILYDVNIFVI